MQFEKYVPRFQAAYKKYYGKEIASKEALDGVIRLFNFAKAVTDPLPKKENDKK